GSRRPGLTEEAVAHVGRLGERGAEQLQGHVAPQDGIVRLPHDAHRPFADELMELELVQPAEGFGVGHLRGHRWQAHNVHATAGGCNQRPTHRVLQSYTRPSTARVPSSTATSRRGRTRSTILRKPSRLTRPPSRPPSAPQANGGTNLGGRTAPNTFAPAPTMVPVPSRVPMAVLA